MSRLERFSERYQPTGGLAAEGVLNQLGRPSTEPLEVLVREAVQNCWDARLPETTVRVEIGCNLLDGAALEHLRGRVLPDPPPELPLAACLEGSVELLHFADFGTSGLGGPTRADAETGEESNFVDFVRNVGQPPDKEFGGGSFGYGKAAFYLASRAGTIIVDTHCAPDGERRLIACGLGGHHRVGGTPCTGRHWWGVVEDDVPEPLTGGDAAEMAATLGLPARGSGDHGTTVAIVAPRLTCASDEDAELGPRAALEFIGECLVWNFWPKMTAPRGGRPAMEFRLFENGADVPVPDPSTHPRLAPFTVAMDVLREAAAPSDPFSRREDLYCKLPRQRVGTIAVRRETTTPAADAAGPLTRGAQATSAGIHHVALMRTVELVVDYLPGPVELVSGRGYAGVFRCAAELDEVFQRSEPPTHDEWRPETLPDALERRFVNTVPRRIGELLRTLTAAGGGSGGAEAVEVPVGRFADDLAALMPGLRGPGARREPAPAGGGDGGTGSGSDGGGSGSGVQSGNGRGPRIARVEVPQLRVDEDGDVAIRTAFTLETGGADSMLSARVEVMTMDGGQVEDEPPIGGVVPEILRWGDPGGGSHPGASTLAGAADAGEWEVWVAHHRDLMVRVAIDVRAAEP